MKIGPSMELLSGLARFFEALWKWYRKYSSTFVLFMIFFVFTGSICYYLLLSHESLGMKYFLKFHGRNLE